MARTALPHDAKAGPTKPEVRSITLGKLDLDPDDHFVEVGPCTGAVTIEAARRAGRVTAIERKPDRLETTRKNLAANGIAVDGSRILTPVAQHFRDRDPTVHGYRLFDAIAGLVATCDTEGVCTAAALADDRVAVVEEPVRYHDGDGAVLESYALVVG